MKTKKGIKKELEELNIRIKGLEKYNDFLENELRKQDKILKFLKNNDRKDVVICVEPFEVTIEYIYQGRLRFITYKLGKVESFEVVKNEADHITFKQVTISKNEEICKYTRLDKRSEIFIDVSDIYESAIPKKTQK